MARLKGRVALITGAARGQGRAHCVRLAENGADIIAVDLCRDISTVPYPLATPDELAETEKLVRDLGRRFVSVEADIRDADALKAAVDAAVSELGRLDIVCANAGVTSYGPVLELTPAQWQDIIDVNLTGTWNTCRAAVPHILAGGRGGSVILTSSTMGQMAYPGIGHYVASKHGVVGLMRAMTVELSPLGIRVNSLHPSSVDSGMVNNETTYRLFRPDLADPTKDDAREAFMTMNLMPVPWVEPRAISDAVLFLASDDSRYVTGTTLVVDAGAMHKRQFG